MRFKEWLVEQESAFESLKNNLDSLGVDHSISNHKDHINVSKIVVPKEKRNSGIGTKAMHMITDHADTQGKRVELTPASDFGGSKSRLKVFYKRHGFVENKGRNIDYSISNSMYRNPK